MVRGLAEALEEGEEEQGHRDAGGPHEAARVVVLLYQVDKGSRDRPYAEVEVEAHGPAVPARDAQFDQVDRVGHESGEEAEDAIGEHQVDVAGLVGHGGPDGQGPAEEAVVGPEDLGVPGVGRGEEDEVGDDGEDGEGADDAALVVEGEADDDGGYGEEEGQEGELVGGETREEDAHVQVGEEDGRGQVDAAELAAGVLAPGGAPEEAGGDDLAGVVLAYLHGACAIPVLRYVWEVSAVKVVLVARALRGGDGAARAPEHRVQLGLGDGGARV